jgi:hypothetical protein
MNKETMLDLIHSELSAEYGDPKLADYALLGTLKSLVTDEQLVELVKMRGWINR